MKVFGWMQTKLNSKHNTKKPNSVSATHHKLHEACKEEFSDWPNGLLLTIGTFGNNNLKYPGKSTDKGGLSSSQNQPEEDSTPHGVAECPDSAEASAAECNLPPEEFSESSQSLEEDDKTTNSENCGNSANKEGHLQMSANSGSGCKGKDIHLDKNNNGIQKKSLSFLFKKTFSCAGGFSATHVLKDPYPEPRLERSRMEKIMRAILHKKIYPQGSSPRSTRKKYLDNTNTYETNNEEETFEKAGDGSKWVKTDSEYIVLEI